MSDGSILIWQKGPGDIVLQIWADGPYFFSESVTIIH